MGGLISVDIVNQSVCLILLTSSIRVCGSGSVVCSFPTANVTFWDDNHKFREVLGSGQAYSVSLQLVTPDSGRNRELGMFMVAMRMYDNQGSTTRSSERSVSLSDSRTFTSDSVIIRLAGSALLKPLNFLGILQQKKTLTLNLFPHFVDDYYHPAVGAMVEVQSQAVEIDSATLTLTAKLSGLKYYMYNWPLVSTVCAFSFNFSLQASLAGMIMLLQRARSAPTGTNTNSRGVPDNKDI